MAGTFFRASPVGRRGGFRLVVDRLYGAKDDEASSGIEFSGEVLRRALLNIYSKDFHPATEIEVNLFGEIWSKMNEAARKGFSRSKAIDPDEDFRNAILRNNAVFSAFKVHRMQNDMARLLLDSDGNLKPFEQWKKEVIPIASHQVGNWLRTEYDTAVLRAHQAADWRQFEREKDVLPNLRWMPSTSVHPGADHKRFWGTVRPIDDQFWSEHRPGDRWNCKCGLSSTDDPVTPVPGSTGKDDPQPGLENNPGKDAKLFSDKHPYMAHAYPGAEEAVEKLMEEQDRYQELPVKAGRLRIHESHGKHERAENIRIGTYLAEKHGYEIDLLDNPNDKPSADSYNRTLGVEQEYKVNSTATKSSIDNLLRDGKKQADDIVLWIDSDLSFEDLSAALRSRVRRSDNIKAVTIIRGEKDIRLLRKEILADGFKIRPADLK